MILEATDEPSFLNCCSMLGDEAHASLGGYLWVAAMFGLLAALEANRIGVFLVSPFGATLTILMLLTDTSVAQPYALIVGSVCGAAVGTGVSLFGSGLGMSVLGMIASFVLISLIRQRLAHQKSDLLGVEAAEQGRFPQLSIGGEKDTSLWRVFAPTQGRCLL